MRIVTRFTAVVVTAFVVLGVVALRAVANADKQVAKSASITAKDLGRGVTGITTQNVDEPLPITAELATVSIKRLEKGLQ